MFKNTAKRIMLKPYSFISPFIVYIKQFIFRLRIESTFRGIVSQNVGENQASNLAVSVFMPVAIKDIDSLTPTVLSLRRYLRHPITELIVCGKNEKILVEICMELGVKFIDEQDVEPVKQGDIGYICNGVDRSGWIYQQLLKVNAYKYCESDHILIWDCDTEMLKPTSFEIQGKIIIEYSEELHIPYDVCTKRLIGQVSGLEMGFTCHKILFSKDILDAMFGEIERKFQSTWYEAIINCLDTDEASSFSEYNVYSQYAIINFAESVRIRHWRNFADVKTNNRIRNSLVGRLFNTVSYHSWAQ